MKRRFSRIRGKEQEEAPITRVPPIRISGYSIADTTSSGIKIGCPYCENTKHFEQYVHETDQEKQFYRCLTCLGSFDFTVVETQRPNNPLTPREMNLRRPRSRSRRRSPR